jgi:hypothetical protein
MRRKLGLSDDGPKLFENETGNADDLNIGINSHSVTDAIGVNNDFIRRVRFTFGQADYKRTVLSLSDEDDPARFDIPEEIVPRQTSQYQFRLDMIDFNY